MECGGEEGGGWGSGGVGGWGGGVVNVATWTSSEYVNHGTEAQIRTPPPQIFQATITVLPRCQANVCQTESGKQLETDSTAQTGLCGSRLGKKSPLRYIHSNPCRMWQMQASYVMYWNPFRLAHGTPTFVKNHCASYSWTFDNIIPYYIPIMTMAFANFRGIPY